MLAQDLSAFHAPYDDDPQDPTPAQTGFLKAIGLDVETLKILEDEIRNDFDPVSGGVGWWAPHPDGRRRILISDHLLQSIGSVRENLVEARLHQLERRASASAESDFVANAVRIVDNEPIIDMPRRNRGLDDLPRHLADLHEAGFFRAVGSAVDCLGAAVIGVGALPTSILKADLARARPAVATAATSQSIAARLDASVRAAENAAGPTGWLTWSTQYRNMLVHRARRLSVGQLVPRPTIYGPGGRPLLRMASVQQLPQDPDRSDIEAFLAMGWEPAKSNGEPIPLLLEEAAETTIDGIYASAVAYVESVAAALIEVWQLRRSDPDQLTQPASQWPHVPSSPPAGFEGYRRGEMTFKVDMLVGNPAMSIRLEAGKLMGNMAANWDAIVD